MSVNIFVGILRIAYSVFGLYAIRNTQYEKELSTINQFFPKKDSPMQLPSYWLSRPAFELTDAYRAAFDALLAQPWNPAGLDYTLDAPKWAFLCYAAEARGLALHGSLNPDITEFEPRQASDFSGNRFIHSFLLSRVGGSHRRASWTWGGGVDPISSSNL
jgi:hypothetical protein